MKVQIACSMDGDLVAIGPVQVPGSRHDAYAYAASGLRVLMDGIRQLADLGRIGVEVRDLVPYKRMPGRGLPANRKREHPVPGVRAAVERAVAHVKSRRIPSEEGGRCRAPIERLPEVPAAITGIVNLRRCEREWLMNRAPASGPTSAANRCSAGSFMREPSGEIPLRTLGGVRAGRLEKFHPSSLPRIPGCFSLPCPDG
jgi:hypothetical protein